MAVLIIAALIAIMLVPLVNAAPVATKPTTSQFSFIGNWNSTTIEGYEERQGYRFIDIPGAISLNITGQKNRVFFGSMKVWYKNMSTRTEEFAGVINRNGKEFKIAEFNEGYLFGEIIGKDEIELFYLEDGEPAKAILETFVRQK